MPQRSYKMKMLIKESTKNGIPKQHIFRNWSSDYAVPTQCFHFISFQKKRVFLSVLFVFHISCSFFFANLRNGGDAPRKSAPWLKPPEDGWQDWNRYPSVPCTHWHQLVILKFPTNSIQKSISNHLNILNSSMSVSPPQVPCPSPQPFPAVSPPGIQP